MILGKTTLAVAAIAVFTAGSVPSTEPTKPTRSPASEPAPPQIRPTVPIWRAPFFHGRQLCPFGGAPFINGHRAPQAPRVSFAPNQNCAPDSLDNAGR